MRGQLGAGACTAAPRLRTRTSSTDSHSSDTSHERSASMAVHGDHGDHEQDETQPHLHTVPEDGEGLIKDLKRLVDDALKLLATEEGLQNWIMGGLLRKSGLTSAFIEALVRFLDLRLQQFIGRVDLRRAAHAVAKCLRRHFQAEDRTLRRLAQLQGPQQVTGVAKTIEMYSVWKQERGYWPSDLPDPSSVDPTDTGMRVQLSTDTIYIYGI
jgi:hypothetical protein